MWMPFKAGMRMGRCAARVARAGSLSGHPGSSSSGFLMGQRVSGVGYIQVDYQWACLLA